MTAELHELTIIEAARLLRQRAISSLDLTNALLARIEKYNPTYKIFITVSADKARASARKADRLFRQKKIVSPLQGIPISLKDNVDTAGVRTTAASKIFAKRIPDKDATVAAKLRQAGAVIIGKTNLSEFAAGGLHKEYGLPLNPWDHSRTTSGSSYGAAVSLLTGTSLGAIGTDTGGSVRTPSAFCSLTGIVGTYGRVSNHGIVPLSRSLDRVGPLAKSVADAALLLQTISGYDPADVGSVNEPRPSLTPRLPTNLKGMTIGIPTTYFYEGMTPEVARAMDEAHRELKKLGARLKPVKIEYLEWATMALMIIMSADGAAIYRNEFVSRPQDFSDYVQARFATGIMTPTVTYLKAQRLRTALMQEFAKAFEDVNAIATPTVPIPPHRLDERPVDTAGMSVAGRCTIPFSLTGLPAMAIPCGFAERDSKRLPISMQIAGRPFDERTVIAIGNALQRSTDWHMPRPTL